MPDIKDSVGDGGTNNVHDVALVQAMLRVVKSAKGAAYLQGNYDGVYGNDTKQAITTFQAENKLLPPLAPAAADKNGFLAKAGPTFQKLVDSLPADYKTITIIAQTKTVYLEGAEQDANAVSKAVSTRPDLEVSFRGNVTSLVNQMYKTYKIVLSVTKDGYRRSFAEQAATLAANPKSTKAGPGESNHNYGRAVDLGFDRLQWIKGDGAIVKDENIWLSAHLEPKSPAKASALWDTRDDLAKGLGLFRIGFERIHLQAFSENKFSAANSLAAHLNAVGRLKWTAVPGKPNQYKSDLGLGGPLYQVGSAKDIWNTKSTVTSALLLQALKDTKTHLNDARSIWAGKPVAKKTPFALPNLAQIQAADVKTVQQTLKNDFSTADVKWTQWKPLP